MHRDIKVENVLVDSEHLVVKLTDFGMACKEGAKGFGAGTKPYMAPEILASDVCACSCRVHLSPMLLVVPLM